MDKAILFALHLLTTCNIDRFFKHEYNASRGVNNASCCFECKLLLVGLINEDWLRFVPFPFG